LGHVVSNEGVSVDPHKIKATTKWPRPKNKTEVKSFLGLVDNFGRLVQNFSKITTSPTNLTWKVTKYKWTDWCEEAFQELKNRITSAPILSLPTNNKNFMLYSDASKNGSGCALRQHDRVIAHAL